MDIDPYAISGGVPKFKLIEVTPNQTVIEGDDVNLECLGTHHLHCFGIDRMGIILEGYLNSSVTIRPKFFKIHLVILSNDGHTGNLKTKQKCYSLF